MKDSWYGFKQEIFEFDGHEAILVYPDNANESRDWILKTEYWGAFPEMEIELIRRGFHCAFLKNTTRFATKADCDAKARFAEFLHTERGLNEKCSLIGMSCGGAHAVQFAGFYPELIKSVYIDAPVLNFSSYPGKLGNAECESVWENEFIKAYPGITRAGLFTFDNHPISRVDVLKANRIPILMLYGTEDQTVIYEENGKILELEYAGSDLLTVVPRSLQGHHPHGGGRFTKIIVDFIIEKSNKQ